MINLSFVEISEKEVIERDFSRNNIPYGAFGFMTSVSSSRSVTNIKDVTNNLTSGSYYFETDYTMLFLYDIDNDYKSVEFIEDYGDKLHNQSSANITILTYFYPHMTSKWHDVLNRNYIGYGDNNKQNVSETIEQLKKIYGVTKTPTLIVIKSDSQLNEQSCSIDLSGYKKEELYNVFKDVIDIITYNCEQDFSVIANKICGPNACVDKNNHMCNFNIFDYIGDLVKEKSKKSGYRYTQTDLASDLGVSPRTIRYRREHSNFRRDECFVIAIIFELSIDELNVLLTANGNLEIGFSKRDGLIRKCIANKEDIYTINDKLKENGYEPLTKDEWE